ncbi:MAG: crossover junction endodeoxyribonuclease RuvC [Rickettsiales bacterium]|nr:crossover junction endodeoxyribonuclease RuvC [Rickettsiales bacterium]
MRIVGIDPGLRHTGWGIIAQDGLHLRYIACGTISPKTSLPLPARLHHLHTSLSNVLEQYQPQTAAMEETFLNKNAMTSLLLGHARGSLMLTLSLAGLPVEEYAARVVKKTVVGTGRAEKEQISMMIRHLLPGAEIPTPDAADALAVAVCHALHTSTQARIHAKVTP